MNYIAHRINTVLELQSVPETFGVEIDLRPWGDDGLILAHDPFEKGEDFETFLQHYRHGTLILNIKSERIEWRVLALLRQYKIQDYFFLDSSFPMMMALVKSGEHAVAVRFSEYESLETVLALRGQVDWVWVDCFSKLPLTTVSYEQLKAAGFKLCLVSPELQGRGEDIVLYRDSLRENGFEMDAICTKLASISLWENT